MNPVGVGSFVWVYSDKRTQVWRVAKITEKDGTFIKARAQVFGDAADPSGDADGACASNGWETIELEHGRFPVLLCNPDEATDAGDPDAPKTESIGCVARCICAFDVGPSLRGRSHFLGSRTTHQAYPVHLINCQPNRTAGWAPMPRPKRRKRPGPPPPQRLRRCLGCQI